MWHMETNILALMDGAEMSEEARQCVFHTNHMINTKLFQQEGGCDAGLSLAQMKIGFGRDFC